MGSIPFVLIQVVMVGLVIAFPNLVLVAFDRGPKIDPSKVNIQIEAPPADSGEIPQIKIQ
jgi:hypothetical protein